MYGGCAATMSQSQRGQHRTKSTNIVDFHSIRSGESSLHLCADSALLSQRKQRVQAGDLCQLHFGRVQGTDSKFE